MTTNPRRGRRVSSFTGLIEGDAGGPGGAHHDRLGEPRSLAEHDESGVADIPLDELPKGAAMGTALHGVFERLDFRGGDDGELVRLCNRALEQAGGSQEVWTARLVEMVRSVLSVELDRGAPAFRLEQVPRGSRLDELGFILTVDGDGGVADIADAIAAEPDGIPAGYPDALRRLGASALGDYLKGFIDLVIERDGRYFLLDYKSNHLGRGFDCYRPDGLARAMADHHYYLQYHLYTVALDRFLRWRLPGYRYEEHFGGVYYLFLRGIDAGRGTRSGVFFERPPRSRIEGLEAVIGGAR